MHATCHSNPRVSSGDATSSCVKPLDDCLNSGILWLIRGRRSAELVGGIHLKFPEIEESRASTRVSSSEVNVSKMTFLRFSLRSLPNLERDQIRDKAVDFRRGGCRGRHGTASSGRLDLLLQLAGRSPAPDSVEGKARVSLAGDRVTGRAG